MRVMCVYCHYIVYYNSIYTYNMHTVHACFFPFWKASSAVLALLHGPLKPPPGAPRVMAPRAGREQRAEAVAVQLHPRLVGVESTQFNYIVPSCSYVHSNYYCLYIKNHIETCIYICLARPV